jgi:hypothetical protein
MKKLYLLAILFIHFYSSTGQSKQDTLTNSKIIKMVKSGINDMIIKKSITTSQFWNFDLSSDGIIMLKSSNVSDSIIIYMFDKGNVAQNENKLQPNKNPGSNTLLNQLSAGIYLEEVKNGSNNYLRLNSTVATFKIYNGKILGISSKNVYEIMNKAALLKTPQKNPTFYLKAGTGKEGLIFDPTRFIVVLAEAKKDSRVVVAYKGLNSPGAMIKNTDLRKGEGVIVPTFTRITDELYKITFEKRLSHGHYFFAPSNIQAGQRETFLEFDID